MILTIKMVLILENIVEYLLKDFGCLELKMFRIFDNMVKYLLIVCFECKNCVFAFGKTERLKTPSFSLVFWLDLSAAKPYLDVSASNLEIRSLHCVQGQDFATLSTLSRRRALLFAGSTILLILWLYVWFAVPDHCFHLIVCQDTSSPHALENTNFTPLLKALAHCAWRSQIARERQ